jgi:formylglycine-generating enzyme required for sulfatase activity
MNKTFTAPLLLSFAALSLVASVALSNSPAAPQQNNDLATKAYAVLEKHCAKCHGNDKTAGFTFHDYKSMVDNGHITPGKPDESRLFVRAVKTPGDPMPPRGENNPLNESETATLKAWIEAGAPQLKTEKPAAPRKFLSEADVLREIEADLNRAGERDRPYLRYFTLTHLANAGASEDDIQAFRVGLSKLLNSLSWQKKISVPQPIDSDKTILRIDMRRFSWTEEIWKKLLAAYPYAVVSETPTAKAIYATTNCPLPYVRADWFVSRAALPPLYHELLDMPDTAQKLEAKLGVEVEKNQKEETAIRAGLQESGVSRNNRVVERHESPYGAYWRSYDFKNNAGKENIFKNPLGFEAAGGEIIFNLPNGLQAYLLVNGKGDRIDTGPIDIVSNKENANDPVVRNGLTCMSCHAQGMKRFSDNMRAVLAATPKGQADFDRDHALALYIEKPKMDAALDEDAKRFADAVRETGATVTLREPIYALQGRYDSTVDIAQAAAEAGLPLETFHNKLQASARLGALLGPLKTSGGRLKRDAWEEYFGDVVQDLHLGLYVKQTVQSLTNAVAHVGGGGNAGGGGNLGIAAAKFRKNVKDDAEMIFIPAGEFTMGSTEASLNALLASDSHLKREQWRLFAGEIGRHKVYLDGYYIYKTPVTVKQYKKFCADTGNQMPPAPDFNPNWSKEDHPIVRVTWDNAQAYCRWAIASLPTEAQWEKAARGEDGRMFPWGNVFDDSCLQHSTNAPGDVGGTAPVGSFPKGVSPYGVLDMAGNVFSWCADWYDENYYFATSPPRNPTGPVNGTYRVLRGGSWVNDGISFFHSASRGTDKRGIWADVIGFRCVVSANSP